MSRPGKPHHLSQQDENQTGAVAPQVLDVFRGSLYAFASALRLQIDDFQRLQRLLDSPTTGDKKAEQVVRSLLVKSLIRSNNGREVSTDQ